MEKIKQKVEQILHHDNSSSTTSHTATGAPHTSNTANTMDPTVSSHGGQTTGITGNNRSDPTGPHDSRLANKADPRVDSDQIGSRGNTAGAAGYGNTHNTGGLTGNNRSDPSGPHDSRLANKADPRVDSDQYGSRGNTAGAGGYGNTGGLTGGAHSGGLTGNNRSDPSGPHDSRLANKADPRVDSDQYGSRGNTAGAGGYGNTGGLTGNTHSGGLTGNNRSDPTGPHDSRLANKLDPRVDSDQMGARGNTAGAGGYGNTGGLTGGTHNTGTHSGGLTGGQRSDPTGPHDTHMANVLDPRVDSDKMGGRGNTAGAGGYGTTGTHSGGLTSGGGLTGNNRSDPSGPHDSRFANKADPRVDSDQYGGRGNTAGAGGYGSSHTGGLTGAGNNLPGPADSTAGPHKSDMMNKVDPRVDSDLDGSKTVGGNRTMG